MISYSNLRLNSFRVANSEYMTFLLSYKRINNYRLLIGILGLDSIRSNFSYWDNNIYIKKCDWVAQPSHNNNLKALKQEI